MTEARTPEGVLAIETYNDLSLMEGMRWTWRDLLETPEEVVYLARTRLAVTAEKQREDLERNKSPRNETRPRNAPPPPPKGLSTHLDIPDEQAASLIGPKRGNL